MFNVGFILPEVYKNKKVSVFALKRENKSDLENMKIILKSINLIYTGSTEQETILVHGFYNEAVVVNYAEQSSELIEDSQNMILESLFETYVVCQIKNEKLVNTF